MEPVVFVIVGALNLPVFVWLAKWMFDGWEGLVEALRFWITPEILSAFRGEFFEDWWAELKLGAVVGLYVGCVYGESLVAHQWLGW